MVYIKIKLEPCLSVNGETDIAFFMLELCYGAYRQRKKKILKSKLF